MKCFSVIMSIKYRIQASVNMKIVILIFRSVEKKANNQLKNKVFKYKNMEDINVK